MFIDFLYSMKDKTVPLTVPATPKKVPTPTSTPASALQTSVTQEESESEEEDDNVKPRGKNLEGSFWGWGRAGEGERACEKVSK